MKVLTLIQKEIGHRKLGFMLSVVAALVAVASFLIAVAIMRSSDLETNRLLGERIQETETEMDKLRDEIRVSMKGLGFNIFIFPEGQDLAEVHEQGYSSKTMPEEYVMRLAESDIVTVNHLLPSLTQVTEWPEHKRRIVLIGIRGQVPKMHGDPQQTPLIDPVPPGELTLGYELHQSLGMKVGDHVMLKGREFKIGTCHEERGSKDDITVWMNLPEMQEMFGMEGRINCIQALECNCATVDRIGEVREEIGAILPGTKIIEHQSKALARAEARVKARITADKQIAAMRESRAQQKQRREAVASALVPLIALTCLGGIALLAFLNARERRNEVGLLLALGVTAPKILAVFLGRAALGGLLGGLIGVAAALLMIAAAPLFHGYPAGQLLPVRELLATCLSMPLFAVIAAWLPSFAAAQYDPAEVLRND